MHNMPGLAVGKFATRPGPVMAATDEFTIDITGLGGHAGLRHIARFAGTIRGGVSDQNRCQQETQRRQAQYFQVACSQTQNVQSWKHRSPLEAGNGLSMARKHSSRPWQGGATDFHGSPRIKKSSLQYPWESRVHP